MIFTGQAEISIDAKQRLAIASKFRAQLTGHRRAETAETPEPDEPVTIWYSLPWPDDRHIRLIPEAMFARLAAQQDASLTLDPDEALVRSTLFSLAEALETDKAGRVRMPKRHLEMTGMPSDVVVIGANHWLEVRDRAAWRASEDQMFAKLPQLIARINERSRR